MVYNDEHWVKRLASMGLWSEAEARQRYEDAIRCRKEAAKRAKARQSAGAGPAQLNSQVTTLFDASMEEQRDDANQTSIIRDGFEIMTISPPAPPRDSLSDSDALLSVLDNVKSIRGFARQEYGKVYRALAPFYFDIIHAKSHTDPIVFKLFRDPERQAKMLANLHTFTKSDWALGWQQREEKLSAMSGLFEGAVLREFEQGYEMGDIDGRMRRFAHVLHTLNGGTSCQELFVQKHPILNDRNFVARSLDRMDRSADTIELKPCGEFFDIINKKVNEQANVISRIFPRPGLAFWAFLDKIREDVIAEYINPLFDEMHERNIPSYLKAIAGIFEQAVLFINSLEVPSNLNDTPEPEHFETSTKPYNPILSDRATDFLLKLFEPHIDLYLQEELDHFTKMAESEVDSWKKKLSEQDATVESFYMSNFQRQAEKKDFLSSFKKVVMMPVSVFPLSPFGSGAAKSAQPAPNGISGTLSDLETSRSSTLGLGLGFERKAAPLPEKAPTDELAAKTELMTSRLEGIKSLFSIEMALALIHAAKESLERASHFIPLGGQVGEEAREQCASIFITLLRILGTGHMKSGFDKAVGHLDHYKAREVSDNKHTGVAPLVMFIELVNVGDLIGQMVDVFYEQQLVPSKISDRNDFLDPAALAKKKFEQMLDESVAAGLNKGIDVLMDEVEYICATMQQPSDYNPGGGVASAADKRASVISVASTASNVVVDPGPTETARCIVDLVLQHTSMLVGSTDKSMLDVFNGEVGLRLFTALCKHLKRQRVSTDGAIKLIADMNLFFDFVRGKLRNNDLLPYFRALRELSQIYLIDARHAKEMAVIIADGDRFSGVFRAEEVYEFAERRADWYHVRRDVERAMYGLECLVM